MSSAVADSIQVNDTDVAISAENSERPVKVKRPKTDWGISDADFIDIYYQATLDCDENKVPRKNMEWVIAQLTEKAKSLGKPFPKPLPDTIVLQRMVKFTRKIRELAADLKKTKGLTDEQLYEKNLLIKAQDEKGNEIYKEFSLPPLQRKSSPGQTKFSDVELLKIASRFNRK